MTNYTSFINFSVSSREPEDMVSIEQEGKKALPWHLFCEAVEILRVKICKSSEKAWQLYTEDIHTFLIGFLALLYAGKEIHLPNALLEGNENTEEPMLPLLSDSAKHADVMIDIPKAGLEKREFTRFPDIDPDNIRVVFHTSGSTGKPKQVFKTYIQIENEVHALAELWGEAFEDAVVFSTVSPQHYYGFLFSALLPFCMGTSIGPKKILYPETLGILQKNKTVLVTSPAFLKRLKVIPDIRNSVLSPNKVFSSGGFLPEYSAKKAEEILRTSVHEIYGSTETGGIGWRTSPGSNVWQCFSNISIASPDNIHLSLKSPYLLENEFLLTEDRVEIKSDGKFILLGRDDSVVKIEEKRVAVNDVENRILETNLVDDVKVVAMENKRQFLVAAVVLNTEGKNKFKSEPKNNINRFFREFLHHYFELTVIPKKWRFIDCLERNSQGKINLNTIKNLFEKKPDEIISEPVFIDKKIEKHALYFTLVFPDNYIHFQGHFPKMKLLPAVVQIDWVMRFLDQYLNLKSSMTRITRFKLIKPIFPDKPVRLEIQYNKEKNQVMFSYSAADNDTIYSRGKILLEAL